MLRFLDHQKSIHTYTDASKYQLGATIKEDNLPIAYFSRILTPTQRQYSTMEQEMLAVVEVLKEFRKFLLGATIVIFTDHKTPLSNSGANDRVFRLKQKIEEFCPTLHYVIGHAVLQVRVDLNNNKE